LLAVLALVATACGDGAEDEVDEQDPAMVAAGVELYEASCVECHGSDLRGTD
jgi:mono/diheme cytochrome c family protein